jgi:RES domain-containing protein
MARRALTPPVRPFVWDGAHRLILSKYSEGGTVLEDIADNAAILEDIILLDGATNDRVQGELHGLSGISTFELVYGIPNAHIVNAAFTHTSDTGGRFNDHTRGAWYAADELDTSIAEVTYHKKRHLAEIIVPELPGNRPDREVSSYDDWLADFHSTFHVLEPASRFSEYLQPEPVPRCYAASQQLARRLLDEQSNGIVYPSVRRKGSTCVVCFRPALVYHPRRGERLEITFIASKEGYEHEVVTISGRLARAGR